MWRNRERWELLGLLDDAGQEFLRQHNADVWNALRDDEGAEMDPEALSDFDIQLQWLLRRQGVPA